VQEADQFDGVSEGPEIAQGLAESAAHPDAFQLPLGHGSFPWVRVSPAKTWPQEVVAAGRLHGDGFPYRPRGKPAGWDQDFVDAKVEGYFEFEEKGRLRSTSP
jgi:hypothetical protein